MHREAQARARPTLLRRRRARYKKPAPPLLGRSVPTGAATGKDLPGERREEEIEEEKAGRGRREEEKRGEEGAGKQTETKKQNRKGERGEDEEEEKE